MPCDNQAKEALSYEGFVNVIFGLIAAIMTEYCMIRSMVDLSHQSRDLYNLLPLTFSMTMGERFMSEKVDW